MGWITKVGFGSGERYETRRPDRLIYPNPIQRTTVGISLEKAKAAEE